MMFQNVSEGVHEGAAVGEQLLTIQWASANCCQKSNIALYLSAKKSRHGSIGFFANKYKLPNGKESTFCIRKKGKFEDAPQANRNWKPEIRVENSFYCRVLSTLRNIEICKRQ